MKILYIFPHPDDESFGPAAAMYRQRQQGHEVHLLTLTKGEATKVRHELGVGKEEMGDIRYQEMQDVAEVLELSSLTVWDWPDSGLQDMDPRPLEKEIAAFIQALQPHILVSYPVHGISGFHDHLVTHALVKRVYLDLLDNGAGDYLKRLAFYTIKDKGLPTFFEGGIRLHHSSVERIDCEILVEESERQKNRAALLCYKSYKKVIEESGILNKIDHKSRFEFYNENFTSPVRELTAGLE